jgi:hypothetical protein
MAGDDCHGVLDVLRESLEAKPGAAAHRVISRRELFRRTGPAVAAGVLANGLGTPVTGTLPAGPARVPPWRRCRPL